MAENKQETVVADPVEDLSDAIMAELGGPSEQGKAAETVDDDKGTAGEGDKARDDSGRFLKKKADDSKADDAEADADDDGEVDADKRGSTRKIEEFNYRFTNLEKRMDTLLDRIGDGKPSKDQKAQLEDIKEELGELDAFKGREDFEDLTVGDARNLVKELRRKGDDGAFKKELDEVRSELNRQKSERAFARENPAVADQYDKIVADAWTEADRDYPGVADDNPMKVGSVRTYIKLIARARSKRAEASTKTATPPVPPRPSNRPDTSTKGAQAVTKGASRAGDANAPVDEDAKFKDYADGIIEELGR